MPKLDKRLQALSHMLRARLIEDKSANLVKQNKGGAFQINASGHEMIGVVAAMNLTPGKDWAFPYYRDQPFVLALGATSEDILAAIMARVSKHHSAGRQMPHHFSHKALRIPCQSSVVGSQYLQAAGVALGIKASQLDEVVYVSGGDGSTSQGEFHEAINLACIHKLPVVFVVQDNAWAISVPVCEQTAGSNIATFLSGVEGLKIHSVDGCSFAACDAALQEAVARGRKGEGPSLIVAKVPRLAPHSSSDDHAKYKTKDMIAEDKKRDPIALFAAELVASKVITENGIEELKAQLSQEIEAAAVAADKRPFPALDTILQHIYEDFPIETPPPFDASADAEKVVIADAINHALHEEMARDSSIIVFGEDVARDKGGVFGITRHLTSAFGESRCFNSPLAEASIVGAACGLSLSGRHRPVCEIQFADYLWPGFNQLFCEISTMHYRSNGEWNCPLVLRMPCGGYIQGGPYHSMSIEAFLAHCPGLKVVMPSNAADAKGLMKAAIRDPNPVIFLEHKGLYRQRVFSARAEPGSDYVIPLGKAHVVREGTDVTFIGWGMMPVLMSEVATRLADSGISVEVIDLRTIVPLDVETILTSVKKTGKVLIAHEAPLQQGFGAEIAAQIAEHAFTYLDAPVRRIGSCVGAMPYCKQLEDAILPSTASLEAALRELVSF